MFAPREDSKKQLFAILLKKTEELGRQATTSDFREDPALPDPNSYAFPFGSFENAAKRAYEEVHSRGLPKKVLIKRPIAHDHTKQFDRPPV